MIADPPTAKLLIGSIKDLDTDIGFQEARVICDVIICYLAMEYEFGQTVARGFACLWPPGFKAARDRYQALIRQTTAESRFYGRIMAETAPWVLKQADPALFDDFLQTLAILRQKGEYTLKAPMQALATLLAESDLNGAAAFLHLLQVCFTIELSYNRSLKFAYDLPKAVLEFKPSRRAFQTSELARILAHDDHLAHPFLDGLAKGVDLLDAVALNRFVNRAISMKERRSAAKYLSLNSRKGQEDFSGLQVAVPLDQMSSGLSRYIRARSGATVQVRPGSDQDASLACGSERAVFSNPTSVYLPPEIDRHATREANQDHYKDLVRLEAGLWEWGTFDFDLPKLRYRASSDSTLTLPPTESKAYDLSAFLALFAPPDLALDIFTACEHARLLHLTRLHYPGLARRLDAVIHRELHLLAKSKTGRHFLLPLYAGLTLGPAAADSDLAFPDAEPRFDFQVEAHGLLRMISQMPEVETSGLCLLSIYPRLQERLQQAGWVPANYRRLVFPLGRTLRPELFHQGNDPNEQTAERLMRLLAKRNITVFKSDLKRHLMQHQGHLNSDDIHRLLIHPKNAAPQTAVHGQGSGSPGLTEAIREALARIAPSSSQILHPEASGRPVFKYKEWDCRLADYLQDHVCVHEQHIGQGRDDFYEATLTRHRELINRIRHAFELLKPEGLKRLRRWIEGDSFDYRALIDYSLDKKAGITPSERIYTKYLKQERDVAVLLLVDLSRSTAHPVDDQSDSVIQIEKQALVLFCEALRVVGDRFAIAGFSGTGRLGVDYFRIKDFDRDVDLDIRKRISALAPRRNTRMGAAIRHAARDLGRIPSKVRLLVILGDGFPNDIDYKQAYAIGDTHKAVCETRAADIFVHAITVNQVQDPRLDELYGRVHHNVISDVRELPDKLLRIYSALTRM